MIGSRHIRSSTVRTRLWRYGGAAAAVSLLFGLTSSSIASATPKADGLVGYWPFDTASAGVSPDLVNSNDAVMHGGATIGSPTTGNVAHNAGSLSLNGTDAFASVAASSDLGMTGAYSVSTWVDITAPVDGSGFLTAYQPIAVRSGGTANTDDVEVYVQATTNELFVVHNRDSSNNASAVGFPAPPLDEWFHLAVAYDGTNVTVYYDGVAKTAIYGSPSIVAPAYTEGGWQFGTVSHYGFGGTQFLTGSLDEVRIYDTALTETQVQALADYSTFDIGLAPSASGTDFTASLTPALSLIPIDFRLSGVNSGSATTMSDGLGTATFAYNDNSIGIDTLKAFVDADNNGGVLDPSVDPNAEVSILWEMTIGGNAGTKIKGGSLAYSLSGAAGIVEGDFAGSPAPFGSLTVLYRGTNTTCTFTPGADFVLRWAAGGGAEATQQDHWVNSCDGTALVEVLNSGGNFPRGAVSIMGDSNTTYNVTGGSSPTWLGLTNGMAHVVDLSS